MMRIDISTEIWKNIRVRRGAALTWVVVIVVALSIIAGGLLYWQSHKPLAARRRHRPINLVKAAETLDLGNGVKLELVKIPAGAFLMGSPDSEPGHDVSESPVHQVTISKPFYIGKFEVTQGQWKVIRGNQSHSSQGDEYPADGVSFGDATNWCKEMSTKLGVPMRLPTEAEWEYACRAGTTTAFAFGETLLPEQANFKSKDPAANRGKTTPVGSFKPNAWGLYDMHGNVWEWCQDTLNGDYENAPTNGAAWIDPMEQFNRIRRGGSWSQGPENCRSAVRWGSAGSEKEPDMRNPEVGFRVVVDVAGAK